MDLKLIIQKEKNDGSYELAKQIQETITSYIDVRDRGVKPERFQVLLQSKMPAVLIECGFLSNDEEAKKLKDEAYQESLAEGIAQGILTYLDTNSKNKDGKCHLFYILNYITCNYKKKIHILK